MGFDAERVGDDHRVTVPTWRGDVSAEADLIEEVARLRGYDSFPVEIRPFRPGTSGDDPQWLTSKRVRETLVGAGLLEVRPMPFVSGGESFVRLTNPLSENEAFLRRDVLDTLARRAEYNLARMHGDIRIFEIGSVFTPRRSELPHEELRVGVLVMGRRQPAHFTDPKSPEFESWARYDEWDAKALGEWPSRRPHTRRRSIAVTATGNADALWDIDADERHGGHGSSRGARRTRVGRAGLRRRAVARRDRVGRCRASRASRRTGPSSARSPTVTRYEAIATTPASEFDLALLVPDGVRGEQVEESIRRVSGRLLERVELFDQYVGEGVDAGHRSLAWRLTFRHPERTLRDREIDARRTDILKALADELNVRQRTS